MNIIREELPPKAEPGEWVAIDVEMFGMNPKLLHRPTTGRFACITICMEHDPETVYFSTSEVSPSTYLSAINDGVWVFQHAKFDIMQLRRYAHVPPRKKLWDTMLIEQIQYHGYYDTFSLADLARRYLGIQLNKSLQKSFGDDTGEMTEDQIQYACMDTCITMQVALHQRKNISQNDFKIWKEIELPFLWALLDFKGFRVDRNAWQEMSSQHQEKAQTLKKLFLEMTGLLPDSHTKVKNYLASKGFKKLPNSQAETLEKYLEKYPDVGASEPARVLLEYKQYSKMASTYGVSLIENYLEEESPGVWVVYGDYKQIGAETSRTCISKDTILSTDLGDFEIQKLELTKDKTYHIISHTGKYQKIIRKIYKGKEIMYEIQTKSGGNLKCTGNHRILTPGGWRFVKDLAIGDLAITSDIESASTIEKWSYFGVRRGNICGISDSQEIKSNKNCQTISQNIIPYYRQFENIISKEILRCFNISETLSILDGTSREYSWKEIQTINIDTTRQTLTYDKLREKIISYSKRTSYQRICSTNQCQILWDRSKRRIALFFTKYRYGISKFIGDICTWIIRCGKKLLRQSRSILRQIIFGILEHKSNNLVYKRASIRSQVLPTEKENTKKSYMLEQQPSRDDFGFSFIGRAYSTYTTIQLFQELSSRFLFSSSKFNLGDSRNNTQISFNTINGQSKETNDRKTRNKLYGSKSPRNIYQPTNSIKWSESEIISINILDVQDVWDIEVENDHSYIAGGFINHNSCTDPNIQNIPNKEEYRSKFIARPGNKLIVADWNQQEPCISTYLSQDANLMKINQSKEDVYIGLAKIFFNDTITKKDPRRKTMKSVYLGLSYGLSAYGLAKKEKIEVDEAEKLIERFFRIFSGFARWSKQQRKQRKFVTTVPGRKVWLNPYSNQAERNALNAPHQGTGSEQMKKSIAVIHQKWQQEVMEKLQCKYPFAIVAEVHDEFILDVPERYAKEIAEFIRAEAVQVAEEMCKGVRFKVGVEIGDNWSAKE